MSTRLLAGSSRPVRRTGGDRRLVGLSTGSSVTPIWCSSQLRQKPCLHLGVKHNFGPVQLVPRQAGTAASSSSSSASFYSSSGDEITLSATPNLTTEEDSAIPTYPKALNVLYLLYICACLVERTWRFGLPLVLAYLDGGYQAIAILGFSAPLACTLLGPAAGKMLDTVYRPYGLGAVVVLQGIAIIASGLTVLATAATKVPFLESPFFGILIALSMLERLTAISSELAIERDWVSQLAGKNNDLALAAANAQLRRSDVSTELVGSLAFGWLYSQSGLAYSISAATLLAAVLVPLEIVCVFWIAKLAPAAMVHTRAESETALIPPKWRLHPLPRKKADTRPLAVRLKDTLSHALDGWKSYFRQPILMSSLSLVLIFCNVALAPGGLITAFLASCGLNGTVLAVFKSGCASMGFVGTWAGKRLIRRMGLLRAGKTALGIQGSLLCAAATVFTLFLATPGSSTLTIGGLPAAVLLFMILVVMSRVGVWAFDMVNAQFFQQTVPQTEMASASAVEMALCSSSELIMLGLAAYVVAPESYGTLVYSSVGAVLLANLVFRRWMTTGGVKAQANISHVAPAT